MVMTDVVSVAANSVSTNRLAGKLAEFLSEDSILRLFATGAAAGIFCSLLIGDATLIDDQEISGANRYPIKNDDLVDEGAGFGGDRLILRFRNSTAGGLVVQSRLEIEPAGA